MKWPLSEFWTRFMFVQVYANLHYDKEIDCWTFKAFERYKSLPAYIKRFENPKIGVATAFLFR